MNFILFTFTFITVVFFATALNIIKDACIPNPCKNGGDCLNDCCCFCKEGFSGKYCEIAHTFTDEGATSTDSSFKTDFSSEKGTSTTISENSKLTSANTRPSFEGISQSTTEESNQSKESNQSISNKDGGITPEIPEEKPETSTEDCDSNPCQNGGTCISQYDYYYDRTYSCSCTGIFSGSNCEITEPPKATTEVSKGSFNSSYITMFSTEPYNLTESTSDENISFSSMDLNSGRTSVTHEKALTENLANSTEPTEELQTNATTSFRELTNISENSTESTEELQTNATTSFQELNLTTTSTTQRISSQTVQTTYFSTSSEQNTLSSITVSKEEMTSFVTSSTDDTITPLPTINEEDSTATPDDFLNATRSTQDTKSSGVPVGAYVGIGVLSIILVLILTGGIIYSKKFRERKSMPLFANDSSSISNGSNWSFA